MQVVVANHNVALLGKRRKGGVVGLEPGTENQGRVFADEFGELRFEFDVDVEGATPSGRTAPGFAFDSRSTKATLIGGNADPPTPREVWEVDGCKWIDRTPATLPPHWPSFRWRQR